MVKTSFQCWGCGGSILGQAAKIPHDSQPKNQHIKQKQYCNWFNKGFKNDPHQSNLLKNKLYSCIINTHNTSSAHTLLCASVYSLVNNTHLIVCWEDYNELKVSSAQNNFWQRVDSMWAISCPHCDSLVSYLSFPLHICQGKGQCFKSLFLYPQHMPWCGML